MEYDYEEKRKKLIQAFKALRKQGFIARADYLCCSSCAGYAIAEKVSKMTKEKVAKVKGCVFWHHQDEQNFWSNGHLYLAYGELNSTTHGKVGLPTKEEGMIVVKELENQGLKVEWDGDSNSRIKVV
jgi:hypothetical protein